MTDSENTPSVLDAARAVLIDGMRMYGDSWEGPIPPFGTEEHCEWVRRQNAYMEKCRREAALWDGDMPDLDREVLLADMAAIADEKKR